MQCHILRTFEEKHFFVALAKNEKEDFHFNNISVLKYLLRETLKNFHF
jgi:hypothetical protein